MNNINDEIAKVLEIMKGKRICDPLKQCKERCLATKPESLKVCPECGGDGTKSIHEDPRDPTRMHAPGLKKLFDEVFNDEISESCVLRNPEHRFVQLSLDLWGD